MVDPVPTMLSTVCSLSRQRVSDFRDLRHFEAIFGDRGTVNLPVSSRQISDLRVILGLPEH